MHLDTNGNCRIRQVVPGKGFVLDLEHFRLQEFSFSDEANKISGAFRPDTRPTGFGCNLYPMGRPQRELILDPARIAAHPKARTESALVGVQYRTNSGPSSDAASVFFRKHFLLSNTMRPVSVITATTTISRISPSRSRNSLILSNRIVDPMAATIASFLTAGGGIVHTPCI